ncbi:hypothetical protein, partial [Sinomicrobium weinanense]|nr:hypothetical protein [Sinomicrobium weinanense]
MNKKITLKSKANLPFFFLAFSLLVLKSTLGFAQQSPFHADSQDSDKDIACLLCSVTNPENAVDSDPNTYTQLQANTVGGSVWQDLAFPFQGVAGDSVQVVIGSGSGLFELDLLGGVTLESFNGATANGDGVNLSNLASVYLLPGTTDRYMVSFPAEAAFDRVRVKFQALAAIGADVRVYGAKIKYGMPGVTGATAEYGNSTTIGLSPVSPGDSIEWFADASGGTAIASGNSYTTPALTANASYFIEITRSGLTQPERYPIMVGVPRPPIADTDPRERVYACSQDNFVIGGVQNPELAADGDPSTYSTFSILKVGAFYQRLSFENCAVKPQLGDKLHVKIGTPPGLLEALGFVGIQAVSNGKLVGETVPLINLISALNGANEYEIVFDPGVPYDGVQITKLSLDSFATDLNIYEAYFYQPATGSVDVNHPVDVLTGTGTIGSTANFVNDAALAFDGNDATFAHLRANLAIVDGYASITALYPTVSKEGDGVRVLLQKQEGGIIDASLLSQNIRIRTYNDNDANSELVLDPELIQLSLFPGSEDIYELIYPVNVPFNRIEVSLDAGLASAFEGLYVYELDRAQDVPGGEFPDPVSPFHATSQEWDKDGLCLLCEIANPEFSIDADADNYAELNATVGIAGGVWQDLIFPFAGLNGDQIEV